MATIIKTDGSRETLELRGDEYEQLHQLQTAVGGYIEQIWADHEKNVVFFGNEEAQLHDLPCNEEGTNELRKIMGTDHTVEILGNIVLCSLKEAGYEEEE